MFIDRLKKAKHGMFLVTKRVRLDSASAHRRLRGKVSGLVGYEYDANRYTQWAGVDGRVPLHTDSTFPVNHLLLPPRTAPEFDSRARVPRKLYIFWAGENEMSAHRRASVDLLRRENDDVEVCLITASDVAGLQVDSHPFHAAYEHLSDVHKSDYLRAYTMRFHGGAYLDVKPFHGRVSTWLDLLDAEPSLWGAGCSELSVQLPRGGRLAADQRLHGARVISQMAFAFKPGTPFVVDWFDELERRLDYFSSLLERFPAVDPFGVEGNYPVPWFSLLSTVQGPLCLKYSDHIRVVDAVHLPAGLDIAGYR